MMRKNRNEKFGLFALVFFTLIVSLGMAGVSVAQLKNNQPSFYASSPNQLGSPHITIAYNDGSKDALYFDGQDSEGRQVYWSNSGMGWNRKFVRKGQAWTVYDKVGNYQWNTTEYEQNRHWYENGYLVTSGVRKVNGATIGIWTCYFHFK